MRTPDTMERDGATPRDAAVVAVAPGAVDLVPAPSGAPAVEGHALAGALRARLGKAVGDGLQSAAAAIGPEQMEALTARVNKSVEEVALRLRAEIAETQQLMREEMQRKLEIERRQMRTYAMWQWIALVAVVLTAVVKEVFL